MARSAPPVRVRRRLEDDWVEQLWVTPDPLCFMHAWATIESMQGRHVGQGFGELEGMHISFDDQFVFPHGHELTGQVKCKS